MPRPVSKKIKKRNNDMIQSFIDNPRAYKLLCKQFNCSYAVIINVLGSGDLDLKKHKKERNSAIIAAYNERPQTLTQLSLKFKCSPDIIGHQLRLAGICHSNFKVDRYKAIVDHYKRKKNSVESLCDFFNCKKSLIKTAFKYVKVDKLPPTRDALIRKERQNIICSQYKEKKGLSLTALSKKHNLNESTIYRILVKNGVTLKKQSNQQ